MPRLLIAAAALLVVLAAAFFIDRPEQPSPGGLAATEPGTPDAAPVAQSDVAQSDVAQASENATDLAYENAQDLERPVAPILQEVRAIADRYGVVGSDAGAGPNDEVALDAPRVNPIDTMNDDFIADALAEENFQAERVVAVIDASPRLTMAQKAELSQAVQVVSQDPAALSEMLPLIERLLLAQAMQ